MNSMRFRAKYVSASENGDYYQVAFENTDPAGDATAVDGPDSPYLLIQRQFEDPDGVGDATLKPITKDTPGIFAYCTFDSVQSISPPS